MAENKQYITQEQENGTVLISEEVIVSIVNLAVSEVEGVAGLAAKVGSDLAEKIGKKNWGRGIRVYIHEDDTLSVECNINVKYGESVVEVANACQSGIISAVESMTGVKPQAVNVNVCGIIKA